MSKIIRIIHRAGPAEKESWIDEYLHVYALGAISYSPRVS
jgi:hypothetical protein